MDDELDRLFGVPLAEFTAARNDLARRLKAAGDGDAAAEVRALSKPSVPVWAVNQLSRLEPGALGELLDAGEALRTVQERVLRQSVPPESLRDAAARQREAIERLTERAREVLERAGRPASAALVERIASTLQAAALDEDGRRLLKAGRLTRELEPAGFEAVAGLPIETVAPSSPTARDELARQRQRREERRRRRHELRQQAQALGRAARDAEREADRAEARAADARRRAHRMRAEADKAEAELADL